MTALRIRKGRCARVEEEEGRVGGDWKIGHSMNFANSPCISLQTMKSVHESAERLPLHTGNSDNGGSPSNVAMQMLSSSARRQLAPSSACAQACIQPSGRHY
jgi:hypothetical protein